MTARRVFGIIAMILALAGTVTSGFYMWFFRMMRGWSHVKSLDDPLVDAVPFAALLASGALGYFGYRLFVRKQEDQK